jgi:prolyl oligopeptidase
MKQFIILFLAGMIMFGCNQKKWSYPETKKQDVVDTYFEQQVADPYRWLENDTAAEVKEWVDGENAITNKYLETIPFRKELNSYLTKIWNFPKYGTPSRKGSRYFYMKNDGLQNQSVLYTQIGLAGESEVLLDPNTLSEDGTVALSGLSISHDGKHLAYQLATAGSDWNEIFVMNIETKEKLTDHIEWVKFSGTAWFGDGFFYSAYDKPKEGMALSGKNEFHKVFFHKLGTPQSADNLIFEDKQHPDWNFGISVSDDETIQFLMVTESTSGNKLYIKEVSASKAAFVPIADNFDFDFEPVDVLDGKILIKTNYKAPKYRLVSIDPKKPQEENWVELLPEDKSVMESVSLIGGKLAVCYLTDAHSTGKIFNADGTLLHDVTLPTIGTVGGFLGDNESSEAFYAFSSYTYPTTIYRYDVISNTTELYRKLDFDFDSEKYETEQVFFPSKDGTQIPMFITHQKGIQLNGNNPLLLYGYGGFNISLTPGFSVTNLPFLNNGGIYVVVNLRGGGEYGKEWHEAGIKMNKQNVFDDFIAAAEWLIQNKYTRPEKLAILGGSNGGLLIGACMTQRPDLFKVAIPQVGVMDMLRYQEFTIGRAWASDYGTSGDSKEMFEYLKSYSPLHNIKPNIAYPATLVTTADHDDRVVPAHSFKFIATLQANDIGTNPVLIRIETNAGHGAGKPTAKIIDEVTDRWAFIMYNLGMKPKFNQK